MAKIEAGDKEAHNHHVNNPQGTIITPERVYKQVKYSQTSLLLFQLKKLEAMDPVERYDYIMGSPESKPLMINVYTGKLIEEE